MPFFPHTVKDWNSLSKHYLPLTTSRPSTLGLSALNTTCLIRWKNLSYTQLRAPFSGRIGRTFVENFEDVRAKEVILSLQNLSAIEIVINVPEQVLALSREPGRQGMEAVATFSAAPDKEYPLSLKEVAAEADRRTQTFAATFTMPQPDEIQSMLL